MNSLYALILIVYIQPYQSAAPVVSRLEISAQYKLSMEQCVDEGNLLLGALLEETNPKQQFAWQDFKCVSLENK